MPIYYSQKCIQTTQHKLNKYMNKIQNYYLRDHLKYKYMKKFYIMLKNKKSMISLSKLHEDIISFIKNDSSTHRRFITTYRPSNETLPTLITEIVELTMDCSVVYCDLSNSSDSSDSSDSSSRRVNNNTYDCESECESSDSSDSSVY
jgi:hypothetical protein